MGEKNQPLSYRMVPRNLDEYIGQQHILGHGKMLRRMIESDRLASVILFGPPGTGKTSLARLIAVTTATTFMKINAVTAGVGDIKKVVENLESPILAPTGRVVLFVDEIHRFNKLQQDALLPHVEDGSIILIGATTENPFFQVNKALISRSTVFQLMPLRSEDLLKILDWALHDKERGLGNQAIQISQDALAILADLANGDARIALRGLELAYLTTSPTEDGLIIIDNKIVEDCIQKRSLAFDHDGESHYDNISALIKSMRGSDPDASIFYLARALYSGEEVEYLGRRIVICAAEDVGLANPSILPLVVSAFEAAKMVGMPEARIILAQAAIAVATSPKSNAAYVAIDQALELVEKQKTGEIPYYLRNAPVKEMKELGYSVGYKYPHDFPYHYVKQQYLPDEIKNQKFYFPSDNGYEAKIKQWLEKFTSL